MKKTLFFGVAAAALAFSSCSNEPMEPATGDGNVVLQLSLPASMQTRAFSNGLSATNLQYAVYEAGTKELVTTNAGKNDVTFTDLHATVTLKLVNGKSYDFIFWAQSPDASCYELDTEEQTITVKYGSTAVSNDETRDAFFGNLTAREITGPTTIEATLYRPFAQINLGTDDFNEDAVKKAYPDLTTELTTTAYTGFNLMSGEVAGDAVPVTFAAAAAPKDQTFPVEGYDYVSMNYLLVGAQKEIVNVEYSLMNAGTEVAKLNLSDVPVQRNYRTNIYGSVFTSPTTLNIDIEPDYNTPGFDVPLQKITTEAQLETALEKGGDYSLEIDQENLDMSDLNPAAPLSLTINSNVEKLSLSTAAGSTQPVTITIPDGVAYPEFDFVKHSELKNVTIAGNPKSAETCNGMDFYGHDVVIDGFTVKGVHFDGNLGLNIFFNTSTSTSTQPYASKMKNITVEDCVFTNITKPAINMQTHNTKPGNEIENITFSNNTVTYSEEFVQTDGASVNALYLLGVTGGTVTVENNVINNAPYHGVMAQGTGTLVVNGNTFNVCKEDGVKADTWSGDITLTGNTTKARANGIRIKNFPTDNKVTITDNTIDMSIANPFANGEPYGILLVASNAQTSPVVIVSGNKKAGSGEHWFNITGVTPAAGSNYSQPYVD